MSLHATRDNSSNLLLPPHTRASLGPGRASINEIPDDNDDEEGEVGCRQRASQRDCLLHLPAPDRVDNRLKVVDKARELTEDKVYALAQGTGNVFDNVKDCS